MSLCAIILGPAVLFYSIQDARSFYALKRRIVSYSLLPDRLAPTIARVQVGSGIAFGVLSMVGLRAAGMLVVILAVVAVAFASAAWHCAHWVRVRARRAVTAIQSMSIPRAEVQTLRRELA